MDGTGHRIAALTAREAGLVGCQHCTRVSPMGTRTCTRCGGSLESRDRTSMQRVWAWWLVGLMAYIPANLYPMLLTRTVGQVQDATIVGGVIELAHHGAYGVAGIVFFASVIIPVGKFIAIAYLATIVRRPHGHKPGQLLHLYEVVEWIGRWSMIDVFVVAILAALVQFNLLATINPGVAAVCFALSVVFTMLAAMSFDSRRIWDQIRQTSDESPA
ncbi:paraquat-inducible protein A [uncultured Jannaschia sp.]|uniref:paraquat-inducible protein A n=1 Tax=uncultured Jannaschia sp. TaxID=293347 RepID=UPI00262603FC|nr:paraquat-inducible protein A [uncultured Jannaschia sp.]